MKAEIIWEAIRDRTLPESRMACRVPTDTRAKSCVHADQCWKRLSGTTEFVGMESIPFEDWVEKCISEQPDRKFLDLDGVTF